MSWASACPRATSSSTAATRTGRTRAPEGLAQKGIHSCDAGTSGGVWGLKNGYCLMVGGPPEAVKHCEPIVTTLAPPGGYAHVGPAGAGHYVKMVHNGIEYGLMQAYAEGFEIMKTSPYELDLDRIASIWGQGSVVRSWLLELLAAALEDDADLKSIRGWVEDSGEGRWTVQASIDQSGRVANPIDETVRQDFVSRLHYVSGKFEDGQPFAKLRERLEQLDRKNGTRGNRLYYLAASSRRVWCTIRTTPAATRASSSRNRSVAT